MKANPRETPLAPAAEQRSLTFPYCSKSVLKDASTCQNIRLAIGALKATVWTIVSLTFWIYIYIFIKPSWRP